MRTDHSERVMKGLLSSLEKADFQEHLHPRARTGKFAKKPAKAGVGAIGAVGAVKVRAVRLPIHLRRATPAEWQHEKKRIQGMTRAQLQTRMFKIKQPQKMKNFAEALEDENYHDLAADAFGRLRAMGYEMDGAPAGRPVSVETPLPPPRPQPPKWRPMAIAPQKPMPSATAQQRAMERARAEGLAEQARRDAAKRAAEAARRAAEEAAAKPVVIGERSAIQTSKEDLEKMTKPGYLVEAASLNDEIRGGHHFSGQSFKVKSADGKRAVWKPRKTTGLEKKRFGTKGDNDVRRNLDARIPEFEREFAAYRFSEEMGMGVVPPVIKADIPIGAGGEGHLMGWVSGRTACEYVNYLDDARKGHIDLQRIAALDFIIGNTDRHQNNFMRGDDGRYYAIDDGLVFPKDSELDSHNFLCDIFMKMYDVPMSPQVKTEIERLTSDKITAIMKEGGFHQEDIDGVIARREVLLGREDFRLREQWFSAATSIARHIKMDRKAEEALGAY